MLLQTFLERAGAERPRSRCPSRSVTAGLARFGERYADMCDRRLADVLAAEDAAEEREELPGLERISCHMHRRWAHECIGSPAHVIPVTGHRWCRGCEAEASVAVDELSGSVDVVCTRCRRTPDTAATRQILRTCRASLATALEGRRAHAEGNAYAA